MSLDNKGRSEKSLGRQLYEAGAAGDREAFTAALRRGADWKNLRTRGGGFFDFASPYEGDFENGLSADDVEELVNEYLESKQDGSSNEQSPKKDLSHALTQAVMFGDREAFIEALEAGVDYNAHLKITGEREFTDWRPFNGSALSPDDIQELVDEYLNSKRHGSPSNDGGSSAAADRLPVEESKQDNAVAPPAPSSAWDSRHAGNSLERSASAAANMGFVGSQHASSTTSSSSSSSSASSSAVNNAVYSDGEDNDSDLNDRVRALGFNDNEDRGYSSPGYSD